MRRLALTEFLRRVCGAGSAALVLALTVFAACPQLHDWLHHGESAGGDDGCAIALFANGVSQPLGAIAVAAPVAAWCEQALPAATEIFWAAPRYLHLPERGPPAS